MSKLLRVGVFRRFPIASAWVFHPVARSLRRSPAVGKVDYHFAELKSYASFADTLDKLIARKILHSDVYRSKRLNEVVEYLSSKNYDIIIPDDTILSSGVIDAVKIGVVLFHFGHLPTMRGLNTIEWSIYFGRQPAATLFFFDSGIDTGNIIFVEEIPGPFTSIADARRKARAVCLKMLDRFFQDPDSAISRQRRQRAEDGVTYYAMCAPLKRIVEARLASKKYFRSRYSEIGRKTALATLCGLPDTTSTPTCFGNIDEVLTLLRAPAQELVASDWDKIISAMHFLTKRTDSQRRLHGIVRNRLEDLLSRERPPRVTRVRLFNELYYYSTLKITNKDVIASIPIQLFYRQVIQEEFSEG